MRSETESARDRVASDFKVLFSRRPAQIDLKVLFSRRPAQIVGRCRTLLMTQLRFLDPARESKKPAPSFQEDSQAANKNGKP
jgi:hypothetical protein